MFFWLYDCEVALAELCSLNSANITVQIEKDLENSSSVKVLTSILTDVCCRKSDLSPYHSQHGSVLPSFRYFSVFELSTLSFAFTWHALKDMKLSHWSESWEGHSKYL